MEENDVEDGGGREGGVVARADDGDEVVGRPDIDEPTLLHEPDLMLALLRAARAGPAGLDAAVRLLLANLAAAREPPPEHPEELRRRLARAASMLEGAEALARAPGAPGGAGLFRLTERGERLLAEHPKGIDASVLHAFPEFRRFLAARRLDRPRDDPRLPAFEAGLHAFARGAALADNPYASDTPDHLAWENGWSEARDGTRAAG